MSPSTIATSGFILGIFALVAFLMIPPRAKRRGLMDSDEAKKVSLVGCVASLATIIGWILAINYGQWYWFTLATASLVAVGWYYYKCNRQYSWELPPHT